MTWGPAAMNISNTERVARCRCLRALVRALAGPSGRDASAALADAERDPDAALAAEKAVEALPTLTMRRIISTFGAVQFGEGR